MKKKNQFLNQNSVTRLRVPEVKKKIKKKNTKNINYVECLYFLPFNLSKTQFLHKRREIILIFDNTYKKYNLYEKKTIT